MAVAFRPPYSYSSHYAASSAPRRHPFGESEPSPSPSHIISYAPAAEMPSPYAARSGSSSRYYDSADYYAEAASHHAPSSTRYHAEGTSGSIRRSSGAVSTSAYETPRRSSSMREHSTRMAGMLGMAAAGAVAGAALTYTVLSRGTTSSDRQFDDSAIPTFQRRSTFPDPYPPSYAGMARYGSGQEGMRPNSRKGLREVEDAYDYDDGRSRYMSRQYRTGSYAGGGRAHSEAPIGRAPLLLAEGDPRYGSAGSYVEPRHEDLHAPMMVRRSSAFERPTGGERDSYVSSRSHRSHRSQGTEPTIRGASVRQATAPPNSSRSAAVLRAASRTGSYRSARDAAPLPSGGGSGYARGSREVPLQASGGGSGYGRSTREAPPSASRAGRSQAHTRWDASTSDSEENDDMAFDDDDSVAPDDSISCVGVRNQRYR